MQLPKPTASRYYPLWAFPFGLSLKVFKTRLLGRGFHTLIKGVSFSSPTDVGSHNPLPPSPFGTQHPRWHSFLRPNSPPPSGISVLAGTPPFVRPLRDSTSSLAYRPVSGSDIICNCPSPPLVDIVLFGLSHPSFRSKFLKHVCWERFPHPYKWCFVLRCGISQY